jgi:hypothetical protein
MAALVADAQPSAEDLGVVVHAQEMLLSLKMNESHPERLGEVIRHERVARPPTSSSPSRGNASTCPNSKLFPSRPAAGDP